MPEEIDLEIYCEEIDDLIKEGRIEEAIASARHLLSVYPKFIEAYRLLGKASLEKGDLTNATEMFLRVLGADPEDLIAYVGLADVYKTKGYLEQAIWYLERALDLEPSHKELRRELEFLYREIGVVELIPHYTLAGLGRVYVKGGLFEQAVRTLNEALSRDPERIDVRVTLAEAQWRMGMRLEAAQTCLEILDVLPYCLKANLILGYLMSSVNTGEARLRFEIAQALDPLNRKAWELFGKDSPLKPRRIRIPRYEPSPAPPPKKEVPLLPEAFELEEKIPPVVEKMEEAPLPPQVEEIEALEERLEELLSGIEEAVLEEKRPAEAISEEVPPWLKKEVAPVEEGPVELPSWLEEEVAEELPLEELPPWLKEEGVIPEELPPEEVPPWLKEEVTLSEEISLEEIPLPSWPEAEISEEVPSEEVPPWLRKEIVSEEAISTVAEEIPAPSWPEAEMPEEIPPEEVPPWFREKIISMEAAPPPELEEAPAEEIPVPSWLKEEVPEGALPEEILAPEELPEEGIVAPSKPEEVEGEVVPLFEEKAPPAPEFIPPSWIEGLKPLAESLLEEEVERALAVEAEMAMEEIPPVIEEEKPVITPSPKPRKSEELLEIARLQVQKGAWEEALRYYRKLSRDKKFLDYVLKDLEMALEQGVSISELFELLGDIYREKGFLDRALEFYRKALRSS